MSGRVEGEREGHPAELVRLRSSGDLGWQAWVADGKADRAVVGVSSRSYLSRNSLTVRQSSARLFSEHEVAEAGASFQRRPVDGSPGSGCSRASGGIWSRGAA